MSERRRPGWPLKWSPRAQDLEYRRSRVLAYLGAPQTQLTVDGSRWSPPRWVSLAGERRRECDERRQLAFLKWKYDGSP